MRRSPGPSIIRNIHYPQHSLSATFIISRLGSYPRLCSSRTLQLVHTALSSPSLLLPPYFSFVCLSVFLSTFLPLSLSLTDCLCLSLFLSLSLSVSLFSLSLSLCDSIWSGDPLLDQHLHRRVSPPQDPDPLPGPVVPPALSPLSSPRPSSAVTASSLRAPSSRPSV